MQMVPALVQRRRPPNTFGMLRIEPLFGRRALTLFYFTWGFVKDHKGTPYPRRNLLTRFWALIIAERTATSAARAFPVSGCGLGAHLAAASLPLSIMR